MTQVLVEWVESFQAELVKRSLKWPKYHSNTAATIGYWDPVSEEGDSRKKARRVLSVSKRTLESMCNSMSSLCLVRN